MPRTQLRSPHLPGLLVGPILCDDRGHPRYWATVWRTLYGNTLASSSLLAKLATIERLYVVASDLFRADILDDLLAEAQTDKINQVLEAFFVRLRNRSLASKSDCSRDWETARSFALLIVAGVAGTGKADALTEPHIAGISAPNTAKKRAAVRAIPADVIDELLVILEPEATRNPFRSENQRWRNYALFLVYLQQGLRRGEALLLPAAAIHEAIDARTGATHLWMNVTETLDDGSDTRSEKPGIKTPSSHRQIPVSEDVAVIVQHYVENFRGRQENPYLFCSNQNRPLAVNSVNSLFLQASKSLSQSSRRTLEQHNRAETVSPHDLRHTCAVARLSAFVEGGVDMKLALEKLRAFFGWTPESDMPNHYARSMFEDRLKSFWQGKIDDRTEFLRQLRQMQSHNGIHKSI